MSRTPRVDRVESALRRADATLEAWFRRAAGALRHPVKGLQGGLERLSSGLEQLEKDRKPATTKRRTRPAASRRPTRSRKPKKAA
jgi:hypothetical protein